MIVQALTDYKNVYDAYTDHTVVLYWTVVCCYQKLGKKDEAEIYFNKQ